MRIGIFGGAFNPIHNGHMSLAENYFSLLHLDKLIFIPTACPPHKTSQYLAPERDRFNMVSLAIENKSGFEISLIEFDRQGKSYTYDTLKELKKIYPDDELFLIIGADQLLSFHLWYRYKEILEMVTLCTGAREDESQRTQMISYAENLDGLDMSRFRLLEADVIRVSSTELRNRIKNNESISNLVPQGVEEYILETGLYNV